MRARLFWELTSKWNKSGIKLVTILLVLFLISLIIRKLSLFLLKHWHVPSLVDKPLSTLLAWFGVKHQLKQTCLLVLENEQAMKIIVTGILI